MHGNTMTQMLARLVHSHHPARRINEDFILSATRFYLPVIAEQQRSRCSFDAEGDP
jgi:hypothetical protein